MPTPIKPATPTGGEVWTNGRERLVIPDEDEVADELAEALLAYAEAHPGPFCDATERRP